MGKLLWWRSPLQRPFLMLIEDVNRVSTPVRQRKPPAKVPGSSMEILSVVWYIDESLRECGSCWSGFYFCLLPTLPSTSHLSTRFVYMDFFSFLCAICLPWFRVKQEGRALLWPPTAQAGTPSTPPDSVLGLPCPTKCFQASPFLDSTWCLLATMLGGQWAVRGQKASRLARTSRFSSGLDQK